MHLNNENREGSVTRIYLCRAEGSASETHDGAVNKLRNRLENIASPHLFHVELVPCAHVAPADLSTPEKTFVNNFIEYANVAYSTQSIEEEQSQVSVAKSIGYAAETLESAVIDSFSLRQRRIFAVVSSKHAIPWMQSVCAVKNTDKVLHEDNETPEDCFRSALRCFAVGTSTAAALRIGGFPDVTSLIEMRTDGNEPPRGDSHRMPDSSAFSELLHRVGNECVRQSEAAIQAICSDFSVSSLQETVMRAVGDEDWHSFHEISNGIPFHAIYPSGDNSVLEEHLSLCRDSADTHNTRICSILVKQWSITVGMTTNPERRPITLRFCLLLHQIVVYRVQYGVPEKIRQIARIDAVNKETHDYSFVSVVFVLYSPKIARAVLESIGLSSQAKLKGRASPLKQCPESGDTFQRRHCFICMGKTVAHCLRSDFGIQELETVSDPSDSTELCQCIHNTLRRISQ